MKKIIVMPDASSAGLFKALVANKNNTTVSSKYDKGSMVFVIFEPDLIYEPLVNEEANELFFIRKKELRIEKPETFKTLKVFDHDEKNITDFLSISHAISNDIDIDIWFDRSSGSQATLLFLLNAINSTPNYPLDSLNIFYFDGRIAGEELNDFDDLKVTLISNKSDLILASRKLWGWLISDQLDKAYDFYSRHCRSEGWFSNLLEAIFDNLPRADRGLDKNEIIILELIKKLGKTTYQEIISEYYLYASHPPTWILIPSYIQNLKDLSLIQYGVNDLNTNFKVLVEEQVKSNKNDYESFVIEYVADEAVPANRIRYGKEVTWVWDEEGGKVKRFF
ncbi:hypothetical protein OI450_09405 [Pectobacterium cacticida]|uniref:DUF1835 domain-containing protein n=1 Tax=Pectobacterium cacticida TaxID=69221 RepID=A0ABZ2G8C5_9GAMM|nr:hypothetical protein [Pectobacterium cacticida]UYX08534.1 hypothetical protein OI450_09405 [Pectobacterium cacticida]